MEIPDPPAVFPPTERQHPRNRRTIIRTLILALTLLTSFFPAQHEAAAQAPARPSALHLSLVVGGRHESGEDGGSATVAATGYLSRFALRVRLADVFTVTDSVVERETPGSGGISRYYWDYFSNGQRRCRDRQTGQFASNSLCSSASGGSTTTERFERDLTGPAVEVGYLVRPRSPNVEVGAGAKIRDKVLPYALLNVGLGRATSRHLFASVLVGPDLAGVEIGYTLRVY